MGLPLRARKVPPSPIYGVRIATTRRSEEAWYEVNAYAGRQFVTAGLIAAPLSGLLAFWGLADFAFPVFLVAVLIVLVATLRYASRYKE